VSAAGLVPIMRLSERAGLRSLADRWLSVPTDNGANAGKKVSSLVGGMVAGADSIDDMAVLRHGGMKKIFTSCYAPPTLGSFLRSFTFGHVRQLHAVATRFLVNLAEKTPLVSFPADTDGGLVLVDVDDNVQLKSTGIRNKVLGSATQAFAASTRSWRPCPRPPAPAVFVAQRLRKGASGSPRGAARIVPDALKTVTRLLGVDTAPVLLRADSAYYGFATVNAALRAGADVSITARQDPAVKRAIAMTPEAAWTTIDYTDAIFDDSTNTWISKAEVAEIPFTAFTSRAKKDHITGRLVVRRIPELNKQDLTHPTLFDTHRFHAFFTTTNLDTVTAD